MPVILVRLLVCILPCLLIASATRIAGSERVVVLGAGPVGLGCALMLRARGFSDVTVVERREIRKIETEKAYLYLLDGRGRRLTDKLGLTQRVARDAVFSRDFTSLVEVLPSGGINVKAIPVVTIGSEKFWIPRDKMLDCFLVAAGEARIPVLFSHIVGNICWERENGCLLISCSDANGKEMEIQADVLIGCDGINSPTRKFLVSSGVQGCEQFNPVSTASDSSGLNFKILSIRSDFKLPNGNTSTPTTGYAIRGIPNSGIKLGLLPIKNNSTRTANIIAMPNHPIWNIKTAGELTTYLKSVFPQLVPFEEYFTTEELHRFATLDAGVFPSPSTTLRNQASIGQSQIVLAGDSVHSFPPDLGQGVNSGLDDIYALDKALETCGNNISAAATKYEQMRIPESIALIKLMQYGYPYQYGHLPWKGKAALFNFAIRLLLNKIIPKIIHPPAFFMIQNEELPYSLIHERAMKTTSRLLVGFTGLLIGLLFLIRKVAFKA